MQGGKSSKRTGKSQYLHAGVQAASLHELPTICRQLAVGGLSLLMDLGKRVSANDVLQL